MWGVKEQIRPTITRLTPGLLEPRHEARAGRDPHHPDEDAQADGVEDPDRRLRDPAEERPHRPEPSEHETHDEGAAAGGEGERHPREGHGQEADEAPENDAGADEDHVRGVRGPVGVAELLDGTLDLGLRADQAHHITPVEARLGRHGHLLAGPRELPHEDAAGELTCRQLGQGLPLQCLVRDHHVQRLDRDVEQLPILDLRADRACPLHVERRGV